MEAKEKEREIVNKDNNKQQGPQPKMIPVQISVSAIGARVDLTSNADPEMTIKVLTMAINATVAEMVKKAKGEDNKIHQVPPIIPVGRGF